MKREMVACLAVAALPVIGATEDNAPQFNPEGTIRTILSAQAYYKQKFPAKGYACDFAALVEADGLKAEVKWTEPLEGYLYRIECPVAGSPQTTFRASAVPTTLGAQVTLCTDETYHIRKANGPAEMCFQHGVRLR